MIDTVKAMLGVGLRSLVRDRVALGLVFVLPIVFFTIFAIVFGRMASSTGGTDIDPVRVDVVDLDQTDDSRKFVESLKNEKTLRVTEINATDPESGEARTAEQRESIAEARVIGGDTPVALIIDEGFGAGFGSFVPTPGQPRANVRILADRQSNPIAPQMLQGMLQKTAMTAAPDRMLERGASTMDQFIGLTDAQRVAISGFAAQLRAQQDADSSQDDEATGTDEDDAGVGFTGPIDVSTRDVIAEKKDNPRIAVISYYAAGTGVMFLLFSAAGAAGSLIEERDRGVLDRLLAAGVSMRRILIGRWLTVSLIGAIQVLVMFVWAWLVFGVNLPGHVAGFTVMTVLTGAAAGAFGMLLATACTSQAQASGLATVSILIMSAVGGSMFPRFMMPEAMQTVGLATFNAWAIDGYRKVFHRELPVWDLWPQALALALMTLAFLGVAAAVSRRWTSR